MNSRKSEFLAAWIEKLSLTARKYIDITVVDAPYLYTEREMNGALLIALSQFSEACIAETHTRRKNGAYYIKERTDTHGRVDFWARYCRQGENTKRMDFYIESKHSIVARNPQEPNGEVTDKMEKVLEQLRQSAETNEMNTELNNVAHLGLQTVVLNTKGRANKDFSHEDWEMLMNNYFSMEIAKHKSKATPDWIGLIQFNDNIVKDTSRSNDNGTWHYHGLLFIAKYL